MSERYTNVNELWKATPTPAITAIEAGRAARRLFRKFGRKTGYPRQRSDAKLRYPARRVWISTIPLHWNLNRGWARLVHDVSHDIHRARYGRMLKPHNPLHAVLELEIAEFVVASGWLTGALRPAEKPAAATRAVKLAKVDAAIKRWDSKLRRAQTALKKLSRRRARMIAAGR